MSATVHLFRLLDWLSAEMISSRISSGILARTTASSTLKPLSSIKARTVLARTGIKIFLSSALPSSLPASLILRSLSSSMLFILRILSSMSLVTVSPSPMSPFLRSSLLYPSHIIQSSIFSITGTPSSSGSPMPITTMFWMPLNGRGGSASPCTALSDNPMWRILLRIRFGGSIKTHIE